MTWADKEDKRRANKSICSMLVLGIIVGLATLAMVSAARGGDDLPMVPAALRPPKPKPPPRQVTRSSLPPVVPTIPEDIDDDPRDVPAPTLYGQELDTESGTIYYVLDISCSMNYTSAKLKAVDLDGKLKQLTRYERARVELIRSIRGLASSFRFGVLRYNCGSQRWRAGLHEASDSNKASSVAWLLSRRWPDGGTGTGPAVSVVLRDRELRYIVLLSDGAPNCGAIPKDPPHHRAMIRAANTQGAVISVFGVAAVGQWRRFCQGVASDSGGAYFDVR